MELLNRCENRCMAGELFGTKWNANTDKTPIIRSRVLKGAVSCSIHSTYLLLFVRLAVFWQASHVFLNVRKLFNRINVKAVRTMQLLFDSIHEHVKWIQGISIFFLLLFLEALFFYIGTFVVSIYCVYIYMYVYETVFYFVFIIWISFGVGFNGNLSANVRDTRTRHIRKENWLHLWLSRVVLTCEVRVPLNQ